MYLQSDFFTDFFVYLFFSPQKIKQKRKGAALKHDWYTRSLSIFKPLSLKWANHFFWPLRSALDY